jgi:hypothetical protein
MKYYIDCEFDGLNGPLLTMAIISETGKSMYVRTDYIAQDPWVIQHVVPYYFSLPTAEPDPFVIGANPPKVAAAIEEFLASDMDPHIIADWPDDIKYFCQYVITGPGQMIDVPRLKLSVKRVDAYPTTLKGAVQHNAWWDAMALRALFVGPEYE